MLGLSEQDYEKDSKIYKNIITNLKIKASKIHKNMLTNLEINVPVALKEAFNSHIVLELENQKSSLYFCKYNDIARIRRDYNALCTNFERELGDLQHFSDPQCVYLVVFRLLNPGLKKSDRYRYIGFIELFDDIIQLVWLHPFFRNKGIMTDFLVWYGTNENIILIQPPILPGCKKVLSKADRIIIENFEHLQKYYLLCRKHLKKRSPEARIDELLDSDLYKVVQGMSMAAEMEKDNDKKNLAMTTAIQLTTDALINLRRNPESLESIENELRIELGVPDDMDL